MKNYPRIHSLCTLGIRQHQAFDYKFHPSRTDFVGDSGCGKSMIADLLQLIFVGSEMYKSGTESTDRRDVDGMVLQTRDGRGTEIAYAFLNIEIDQSKFLIVGAYLESTTKSSKSFIVNSTYDENELVPMDRYWNIDDISGNGQIPTLVDLNSIVENKGAVLHTFGTRKKFHSYLYIHKILPLDLASSKQLWQNYSTILQSFSRGRNLDIKKSESLKQFLFGDDRTKEIREKYKKAVEDLKNALNEYSRNSADIHLSTIKHRSIFLLKNLKDDSDIKQRVWLEKLCAFRTQEENRKLLDLQDSVRHSLDGYEHLNALLSFATRSLSSIDSEIAMKKNEVEIAHSTYNNIVPQYTLLAKFSALRAKYQCSDAELNSMFTEYENRKAANSALKSFLPSIVQDNLEHLLNRFDSTPLPQLITSIDKEVSDLANVLEQKRKYLAFTNINSRGSFGSWAIRNGQQLSREIESIVMHYKDAPVALDTNVDLYISSPDAFIRNPEITNIDSDGFWLSIGETRQYIQYVTEQLFTTDDIDKLLSILGSIGKNLRLEIINIETEKDKLERLKEIALKEGFANFLRAYANREVIEQFMEDEHIEDLNSQLSNGMLLLKEQNKIEGEYSIAKSDWESKLTKFNEFEQYTKDLAEVKEQVENLTSATLWADEVTSTINEVRPSLNLPPENSQAVLDYFEKQVIAEENKGRFIKKFLEDNKSKLKLQDILVKKNAYSIAVEQTAEALKNARLALGVEPDISAYEISFLQEPKSEESDFKVAISLYENKFDDLVIEYAKHDQYRFSTSKNFIELCTTILPEAFVSGVIEEAGVVDAIERYLVTINEKNKNLNKRKLQRIRDVLEEVIDEVNGRLNTVREIRNFLNHEDREITGGHRVHLRSNTMTAFPKEWIDKFIQQLSDDNTLFAADVSVNDRLIDGTSLDDKLIQAFQIFSEYKRDKPKVEQLLDPNNYFDLSFTMESIATGKMNSGSTGQTYAAIALLCIARLSLVNKSTIGKVPSKGIRFMPIDEAEGLGSNFDMLNEIARQFDYQIITMSINPLGKFTEGQQYIYMLSNNKSAGENVNNRPFAIFYDNDLTDVA